MALIDMWRARVPGTSTVLPMIAVGGLPDAELEVIAAQVGADDLFDIIDDHTSWIWFSDRASWLAAWRMARGIASGQRVVFQGSAKPRMIGRTAAGTIIDISAHHATEAA